VGGITLFVIVLKGKKGGWEAGEKGWSAHEGHQKEGRAKAAETFSIKGWKEKKN